MLDHKVPITIKLVVTQVYYFLHIEFDGFNRFNSS